MTAMAANCVAGGGTVRDGVDAAGRAWGTIRLGSDVAPVSLVIVTSGSALAATTRLVAADWAPPPPDQE
jgi:hypothetical protein